MSAGPRLVWRGHRKVAIQQVGCDRQAVSAVGGGDAEASLATGADTVLLHQPLHTLLADAYALSAQFAPDVRPAVSSAIGRILHEYAPAAPRRSGDDAERFRADEQGVRGSQPHLPPASGTAHGSATHADCVESWRTSLLPLGEVRRSFSQDVTLHRDPRQLGSQTADLHLLSGYLRPAVGTS